YNGGNATLTARLKAQGSSAPEVQAVAALNTAVTARMAPTLALQVPGSLPLLGEPAAISWGAGVLSSNGLTGNVTLTLQALNPNAGQWVIAEGQSAVATLNASGHVVLTGTVAQLNAWLADGRYLAWRGNASSVVVTAISGQAQAKAQFDFAKAVVGVLSVATSEPAEQAGVAFSSIDVAGNVVVTNEWLSQRGLDAGAALKLRATGNITWQASDVSLASIDLQASGVLVVQGTLQANKVSLLAGTGLAGNSTALVQANQLALNTSNGNVGSDTVPLRIQLTGTNATLTGNVKGAAYLSEIEGDLLLDRLRVSGIASLRAETGSILGVSQAGFADLQASSVALVAGSAIGALDDALLLNTASFSANGVGRVLVDTQGAVSVSSLAATGADALARVNARGNLSLLGTLSSSGSLSLNTRGELTQSTGSSVSAAGALSLSSVRGNIVQSNGASLAGAGVTLDAGAGMALGNVNAGTGLLSLTARAGSVTDADASDNTDLNAGSVWLSASEAIGENVLAGGRLAANGRAVNALDMNTAKVSALSAGSINLTNSGNLQVSSIGKSLGLNTTDGGDINLTVNSATHDAVLTVAAMVKANEGAVNLTADKSVNLLADGTNPVQMGERVLALNDITITATEGLRLVGSDGKDVAGVYEHAGSPGVIRIVGKQTIANNQTVSLKLNGLESNDNDQLWVSSSLTLAENSVLDIQRSPELIPRLERYYDLIGADVVLGRFGSGKGMFGFGDSTNFLQVNPVKAVDEDVVKGIVLTVSERPGANKMSIKAHSVADADTLGTFFNSPYFGEGKNYSAGMTVQAANFVTVDGRFALSTQLKDISVTSGAVSAHTWLIGGNNLDAFVGLNGPYRLDANHDGSLLDEVVNTTAAGFELTGLDIGLALYQDANSSKDKSPRNWLSLAATAASATEVGLPLVGIRAEDLKLEVNLGSDGSVVNYAAPLKIATGGTLSNGDKEEKTLNFLSSQGTLVRASGYFEMEVDGFFSVAGNLGFEKSTRAVTLADGTELNVNTLNFGGEGLRSFAGVNGPYWRDLNGDRVFTEAEADPNAVGMVMGDVKFGLVLASAVPGTADATGLQWTALKASAGTVAFVGVPGATIAARDLAVDINLVSGVGANFDADTKVIDFTAGTETYSVVTGTGKTLALDMPGESGQLVRASGTMDLRVGDFFQFTGSMGMERRAQDVTLADGTQVETEMLSVGGTGLTGFVGLGPYGSDTNGNGKFDNSEVNPNAKGLGVRDVEFGLAIFNGKAAYEDTQWLAMTGSVGGVDLMLGLPDNLKLQVYNLGVDLNMARHEADVTSAPLVHVGGDYATDANASLILGSSVFGSGTENLSVTVNFNPVGVDSLSLKDVDLSKADALPLVRSAAKDVAQVSTFIVAGAYAVDDVITLSGLSPSPLSYKVLLSDLQDELHVPYSVAQAQSNIAAKLRGLVNGAAANAIVTANGAGAVISLLAKTSGEEGQFSPEVSVIGLGDLLAVDMATLSAGKINSLTLSGKAIALSAYFDLHSATTGLRLNVQAAPVHELFLNVKGEGGETFAKLFYENPELGRSLGSSNTLAYGYFDVQPAITALSSKAWVTEDAPSDLRFDTAEFTLLGTAAADRTLTLTLTLPTAAAGAQPVG
ncbi:MAG: hypothetical protein RLZZ484_1945, partial [Pseudomonadota bacterium]